jgi:hypothetical protein
MLFSLVNNLQFIQPIKLSIYRIGSYMVDSSKEERLLIVDRIRPSMTPRKRPSLSILINALSVVGQQSGRIL